jgi:aspartyl-tRNA(Asn)/glutamyl-tRNA(Gln) amidotransferase subunit A
VIAQQARRELTAQFREATEGLDATVVLSSFFLPCRIDDESALAATYDRHARGIFNVTGDPAIAVPVGFSPDGMPLGVQIAAPAYRECELFAIAHALETELGATLYRPAPFSDIRKATRVERSAQVERSEGRL